MSYRIEAILQQRIAAERAEARRETLKSITNGIYQGLAKNPEIHPEARKALLKLADGWKELM